MKRILSRPGQIFLPSLLILVMTSLSAAQAGNAPTAPRIGEYYVAGAERSGTYSLTEGRITVRQALISAGVPNRDATLVLVRRDPGHGVNRTMFVPVGALLDGKIADFAVELADVLILADERPAPSKDRAATYKVSGAVPNPGDYSLAGRRINVLQALVVSGANPANMGDVTVTVRRATEGQETVAFRSKVLDVIFDRDGGARLEPGDHVIVGEGATAPKD